MLPIQLKLLYYPPSLPFLFFLPGDIHQPDIGLQSPTWVFMHITHMLFCMLFLIAMLIMKFTVFIILKYKIQCHSGHRPTPPQTSHLAMWLWLQSVRGNDVRNLGAGALGAPLCLFPLPQEWHIPEGGCFLSPDPGMKGARAVEPQLGHKQGAN